jgi:hypothetical protein
MVTETLDTMARGGIHDQIGGGFHRYSTDNMWLIPHFEKMLYDQATLLIAYTETYLATQDPKYSATAQDIADYTLRDLTSPEGAFYSAEDADSEGVEGKFYTWTLNELKEKLGEDDASAAAHIYGVTTSGNLREYPGSNVLHLTSPEEDLADELGYTIDVLHEKEKSIRGKLLEARNTRTRPLLDDKILTDWNGLMIAALSKTGATLGEESYIKAAEKAAHFISIKMNDGGLLHRYRRGEAAIPSFLDDYAYYIWGLLELYEATFEVNYLKEAKQLAEEAVKLFQDHDLGGLYLSRSPETPLPRAKETYDGAKPSGTSVMVMNLLRLGKAVEEGLEATAEEILKSTASLIEANPISYTYLLCALDYSIGPSYEVIIAGGQNPEDTNKILEALRGSYTPNKLLMLKTPSLNSLLPHTTGMQPIEGKPAIYICRNRTCSHPITDIKEGLTLFLGDSKLFL